MGRERQQSGCLVNGYRWWVATQFFAVSVAQHGMLVGLTLPIQVEPPSLPPPPPPVIAAAGRDSSLPPQHPAIAWPSRPCELPCRPQAPHFLPLTALPLNLRCFAFTALPFKTPPPPSRSLLCSRPWPRPPRRSTPSTPSPSRPAWRGSPSAAAPTTSCGLSC